MLTLLPNFTCHVKYSDGVILYYQPHLSNYLCISFLSKIILQLVNSMRVNQQHTHRKTSVDHGFRSNSHDPDLSAFFIRRRKTDKSVGDSEPNSSPVSPSFLSMRKRPTQQSGDSNKSNANLEVHSSSVGSSLSATSKYPLNVSD